MKRFIVSILAILYLATASGATVHLHYCMGKLMGISLSGHNDDHKCSRCGMTKKSGKGCCKDENKVIKATHEHIQATQLLCNESTPLAIAIPTQYYHYTSPRWTQPIKNTINTHAPPISSHGAYPIYLRFRNIRI